MLEDIMSAHLDGYKSTVTILKDLKREGATIDDAIFFLEIAIKKYEDSKK